LSYVEREHDDILSTLETGRELTDDVVAELNTAIAQFTESHENFFAVTK
jgi:hypothetical protein